MASHSTVISFPHVLAIDSDPFERGREVGRQTAREIHRSIAIYEQVFAYHAQVRWPRVREFAARYVDPIADYDQATMREIEGLADGAGLALQDVVALNARSEIMFGAGLPAPQVLGDEGPGPICRRPDPNLSANSTRLLLEYGFAYDSSMMAQDFEPYWCRTGDQCPPDRAFVFGEEVELVELPVSWSLDDFPQLEFMVAPGDVFPASNNPAQLEQRWLEELDFAATEVPGGVFTMTFHPQSIGRGACIRILERMIAAGKRHGAQFVTAAQAASSWRASATAA